MRSTVVWVEEAEEKLANAWMNDPGHAGITAASDWIDRTLLTNPKIGQLQGDRY